ncbi:hypothetical protein CAPTEDRAFT_220732 [Capitella teleta]|uniref:Sulfotransferase domain-containing protein n=1 Tax=Capitella teleta TaxID=283909 RepID=R7TFV7_CAPTE|nr:hypothetical protein CAPTEDRAFT_220732 [Capitella teleta]|eukprot:ELT92357.1 hypothetical protein CAPTEDRAFT_220732 [Capitella teleta]
MSVPVTRKCAWEVPGMTEWRGMLCPTDMTPEIVDWIEKDFAFEDGDVLLLHYCCSGVQWSQEVVYHICHPDQIDLKDKTDLGFRVPFFDREHLRKHQPWDIIRDMGKPRLLKTHLPEKFIGEKLRKKNVKVIYQSMNPRNALVKYQHLCNFLGKKFLNWNPIEWDDYFEAFKKNEIIEGDWFDFTLSWMPYFDQDNFLCLTYEEAAKDLEGTVRKIAKFLGRELTDEQVTKIAAIRPYDNIGPVEPSKKFTDEQMAYFNDYYKQRMTGTPFENLYPK